MCLLGAQRMKPDDAKRIALYDARRHAKRDEQFDA
jgi:hypothetical protein